MKNDCFLYYLITSFFVLQLSWISAGAMSKPSTGGSVGSWEVGGHIPMTSEKDPWKSGLRLGITGSPLFASAEFGFDGNNSKTNHLGLNLGLGSGPLVNPPGWLGLQWFGRFHFFAPRWRAERFVFYSALEVGTSQRLSTGHGWWASISVEYPGLLLVPSRAFPRYSEDLHRQDGVVTFLNFGVAFGSEWTQTD
jgi:hypothetical protein